MGDDNPFGDGATPIQTDNPFGSGATPVNTDENPFGSGASPVDTAKSDYIANRQRLQTQPVLQKAGEFLSDLPDAAVNTIGGLAEGIPPFLETAGQALIPDQAGTNARQNLLNAGLVNATDVNQAIKTQVPRFFNYLTGTQESPDQLGNDYDQEQAYQARRATIQQLGANPSISNQLAQQGGLGSVLGSISAPGTAQVDPNLQNQIQSYVDPTMYIPFGEAGGLIRSGLTKFGMQGAEDAAKAGLTATVAGKALGAVGSGLQSMSGWKDALNHGIGNIVGNVTGDPTLAEIAGHSASELALSHAADALGIPGGHAVGFMAPKALAAAGNAVSTAGKVLQEGEGTVPFFERMAQEATQQGNTAAARVYGMMDSSGAGKLLTGAITAGKDAAKAAAFTLPYQLPMAGDDPQQAANIVSSNLGFGAAGALLHHFSPISEPNFQAKQDLDAAAMRSKYGNEAWDNLTAARVQANLDRLQTGGADPTLPKTQDMASALARQDVGAVATMIRTNPQANVTFDPTGSMNFVDKDGVSTINVNPNTQSFLPQVIGHELIHHINNAGQRGAITSALLGDPETKTPGVLRSYSDDGTPIDTPEFKQFRSNYEKANAVNTPNGGKQANADQRAAEEFYAEAMGSILGGRTKSGELNYSRIRRSGGKDVLLEKFFGKNSALKLNPEPMGFMTNPDGTQSNFNPLEWINKNPSLKDPTFDYLKGKGYLKDWRDKDHKFENDFAKQEVTLDEGKANPNEFYQRYGNDPSLRFSPPDSKGNRSFLGVMSRKKEEQLAQDQANELFEGLKKNPKYFRNVTLADGKKQIQITHLDDTLLSSMRHLNDFHKDNLMKLNQITGEQGTPGTAVKITYQPALTGGKRYAARERTVRDAIPYDLFISQPDKGKGGANILTHILDLEQLWKNRGTVLNLMSKAGLPIPAHYTDDEWFRSSLEKMAQAHFAGKKSTDGTGISENEKDFLNSAIGAIPVEKGQPVEGFNQLLDSLKAKAGTAKIQSAVKSFRLDRINKIEPVQNWGNIPFQWQGAKFNRRPEEIPAQGKTEEVEKQTPEQESNLKQDGRSDQEYYKALQDKDYLRAQELVNQAGGVKLKSSEIERGDGIHAPADPESGAPAWNLTANGIYPKDVYSHNGLKYYGTGEDALDRMAYQTIQELKGRPKASVKIYRAVEKDSSGVIKPGDWVTTVRKYAIDHGKSNITGGSKILSKTVPARDIYTSGDSWLEWGYHPQDAFPSVISHKSETLDKSLPVERRFKSLSDRFTEKSKDIEKPFPEKESTLQTQQKELIEGKRPAMLFTPGEKELPIPDGLKSVKTSAGVFHYDPEKLKPLDIKKAVRDKKIGDILDYGISRKPDVKDLHGVVTRRGLEGEEIEAVATDKANLENVLHKQNERKSEGQTVGLDTPEKVVGDRMNRPEDYNLDKVYYHGTIAPKNFKTFKSGNGELGHGIYVTSDPEMAKHWARGENGRIIPVHLRKGDIYNPLVGLKPVAERLMKSHPEVYGKNLKEALERVRQNDSIDRNGMLAQAGYIGAEDYSSQIPGQIVVFKKGDLKSSIGNNGKFNPDKGNILHRPEEEKPFYSTLQKVLSEKMGNKATADQIRGMIKSLSQEEVKWSGIEDYLKDHRVVVKSDLLKHLKDNEPKIEMEELAGEDRSDADYEAFIDEQVADSPPEEESGISPSDLRHQLEVMNPQEEWEAQQDRVESHPTKFEKYQLPGGTNYREQIFHLPPEKSKKTPAWKVVAPDGYEFTFNDEDSARNQARLSGKGSVVTQKGETSSTKKLGYTSSHFPDTPNYLAHIRLNDREDSEGNPGTLIEELQSDRHQAGRENGYENDEKYEAEEKNPGLWKITKKSDGSYSLIRANTQEEALKNYNLNHAKKGIPDAPLRKTWPEFLFKKALTEAASNGKKWIGWTTGDTQAERFDLSKQVKHIAWEKDYDGTYSIDAPRPDGSEGVEKEDLEPEDLKDLLGKEIADKILNGEGRKKDQGGYRDWRILEGEDLTVGGHGMKGFYDKIVPSVVAKIVKKWGVKPELKTVRSNEDNSFHDPDQGTPREFRVNDGESTDEETISDLSKFAQRLAKGGFDTGEMEEGETWNVELTHDYEDQGELSYDLALVANGRGGVIREDSTLDGKPIFDTPKTTPIWKVPITDKMRQDILSEGFPMFRPEDSLDNNDTVPINESHIQNFLGKLAANAKQGERPDNAKRSGGKSDRLGRPQSMAAGAGPGTSGEQKARRVYDSLAEAKIVSPQRFYLNFAKDQKIDPHNPQEDEEEKLFKYAKNEDLLIPSSDIKSLAPYKTPKASVEHDVYLDPKTASVVKVVKPGRYGIADGNMEYFQGLHNMNLLTDGGLGIQIIGVTPTVKASSTKAWPSVVSKMNLIEGVHPERDELRAYMKEKGWKRIPALGESYEYPGTGVQILDAHSGNFIKQPSGVMMPIDVHIKGDIRKLPASGRFGK